MSRVRNKEGNPDIVRYGEEWRRRTPNWEQIITHYSKTRSTGPRTPIGKFRSSLNAIKYELDSRASRIRTDSMLGKLLLEYWEELEKKKKD